MPFKKFLYSQKHTKKQKNIPRTKKIQPSKTHERKTKTPTVKPKGCTNQPTTNIQTSIHQNLRRTTPEKHEKLTQNLHEYLIIFCL